MANPAAHTVTTTTIKVLAQGSRQSSKSTPRKGIMISIADTEPGPVALSFDGPKGLTAATGMLLYPGQSFPIFAENPSLNGVLSKEICAIAVTASTVVRVQEI